MRLPSIQLTAAQIASLGRLPPQLRLDRDVVAIHGTPRSDLEYPLEDVVEGRLLPAAADRLGPRLGELSAAVVLVDTPIRPASCARGKTC